ncbi:MAG: hypothetical protein VB060_09990 [Oscillibacter sp.]|nr:hypothetical protein [Oscillibacter sp.]MEA4994141.1 hypothetical protein [Oscillibacter sp.]
MKNRFAHFSIRFLTVLLAGLFLLLLRSVGSNPVFAVLTPRFASPWELGKLLFWPLLLAAVIPFRDGGKFSERLPWLTLTPLAAVLIFWALTAVRPGPGAYLLAWIVLSAMALALAQRGILSKGDRSVWMVLAVAMGILFIMLTFLPPAFGPFLDPTDVAAMATIPC